MEYKEGENLEHVLQHSKDQMYECVEIFEQILLLLSYIHSFQPSLIHRDIKPSNLLVQEDGRLVLIDFGIAVDDVHRTFGKTMNVGTMGYQAPEQAHGDPTTKSDLYSVGVIAVELFTRTKPSDLVTHQGVFEWERKCMDLPMKWYRWLEKMLNSDPKKRFVSASEAIQNMPEIDIAVEQQNIDRAIEMAHVPNVPKTSAFSAALEAQSKEQRAEELAKEERRREIERQKQEAERKRQIEAELKRKEVQRREEEKERRKQELLEAIDSYSKNLEAEFKTVGMNL